jgi:hypothetical protein
VKAMAPRVGFSSATAEATEELFRLWNDGYGCSISVAFPAGPV